MAAANKKIFTEEEKQQIIYDYSVNKMSGRKLGEKYGCSSATILKNIKEWGIEVNNRTPDLTGKVFGELTVIEKAPKRPETRFTEWRCKCSCGNETLIRTQYLNSGHTTSCGHKKAQSFKKLDLTGQRFGRLVVIEDVPPDSKKCLCDCGNYTTVKTYNLTNGNTQSCGCLQKDRTSETNFKSLVGQRFGKLTVIERVENNKFGHVCYKCKCDCGGTTIVDATNLRNGNTSSCGCIKSKGEMQINLLLQKYKINFVPQYSIESIVLDSNRRPFFDFAIFDNNNNLKCLIEYNGKQHYEYSGLGWDNEENFLKTQYRDQQKAEQCKANNIPLYYIKYNEEIEPALLKILKEQEVL